MADLASRDETSQPRHGDAEQVLVPLLPAAYDLARWLARDPARAEDLVQTACLRAVRSFASFRGGSARSWLLRIVRNVFYDSLAESRRAARDISLEEEAAAGHEPADATDPEIELLRRADAEVELEAARTGIGEGIERATRLVEQLLALARSEPGTAPAVRERVDLADIARRMAAETVPFAASRRIELELTAPAPAFVAGDPVALALLVRNLIDNAARYSPPGSRVELAVAGGASGVTLTVDDAGPGIPEAERQRVFDRFHRRAEGGESGSGLGLAIVRSVAVAHGATVALDRSPQGGLRAVVRFAAAPSDGAVA